MRAAFLVAVLSLAAVSVSAAEVYRLVNPDGTVSYSDRPADATAEAITINTRQPAQPPAPSATASGSEAAASTAPEPEPTDPQPTTEELAAQRDANCAAARERDDRYQMSRRLYRSLPNGEREYLTDDELDAARAGAAADVEQWCN